MSDPTYAPNKVWYGLSSAYYAKITEGTGGALTFGTPVALKGAVATNMAPQGETVVERADNIDYWVTNDNRGYTGTLELETVPDSFLKDILGEEVDSTSGLQYEVAGKEPAHFALLFQIDGDQNANRHVFYNCVANRVEVGSETTPDGSIAPHHTTLNITAKPMPSTNLVKGKVDMNASAYATFFSSVVTPSA